MSHVDVRAWFLTNQERENPHTRIDDVRGDGTAWSSGNTVRAIVHGRPYFEELHERITGLGPGDRLYFADWRGDPDEQLTDDPGSTLNATLVAAARGGVDVRGLLWRSHWHRLGFSAHRHRYLGDEIGEAGGQCLRDMRVRNRGAHHQKFVVIRYVEDPTRDIAYVGGIDLCHGRRDDDNHDGDPQAVELAKAYGPTPAWHDVQVAIQGPAVHDVETTFRERWEDSTPLTLNPGRLLSSWVHQEDLSPEPLGAQSPPPPPRPDGHDVVQIVRTFPVISPKGFDFAPEGERSVMLGNTKAIAQADRLVYVEDQYLWSADVGEHFGRALRENPELRLVVVLPMVPDREGALAEVPQLYGRSAGDAHDHRGGRRPGRGVRPVQRGRATDLRALQDLRHRPPLGQRGLGQPQPALVDQRQRDRLHRGRRAWGPGRARARGLLPAGAAADPRRRAPGL